MMPIYISIIYVLMVIGISLCIHRRVKNRFVVRKIIHMGMASWWFIRLQFLDSKLLWLGPALFIFINMALSTKLGYGKGITHFAISLTGLTLLSMHDTFVFQSTGAMLVLGYADPIAAIVGRERQIKKNLNYEKSILGSVIFFGITFIVLTIVCGGYHVDISITCLVLIAIITAFSESRILPAFDNLVIPAVVFIALCFLK